MRSDRRVVEDLLGVNQATNDARADEDSGEVPKAIVVAREPLTAEEVKAFVEPKVAHYKRIRHVEFVDAIPKSPSGKILRRVLVEKERAVRA